MVKKSIYITLLILISLAMNIQATTLFYDNCEGTPGGSVTIPTYGNYTSTSNINYSDTIAYSGTTSCRSITPYPNAGSLVINLSAAVTTQTNVSYTCKALVYQTGMNASLLSGGPNDEWYHIAFDNSFKYYTIGYQTLAAQTTGEWWNITISYNRTTLGNSCSYYAYEVDGGTRSNATNAGCYTAHDTTSDRITLTQYIGPTVYYDDIKCWTGAISDETETPSASNPDNFPDNYTFYIMPLIPSVGDTLIGYGSYLFNNATNTPLDFDARWYRNNTLYKEIIGVVANNTRTTNYSSNTLYNLVNLSGTETTAGTSFILSFKARNASGGGNSSWYNTSSITIGQYLRIYANGTNGLLSNIIINISATGASSTNNPYQTYLSNVLNSSVPYLYTNVTVTDLSGFYQLGIFTINITPTNYTFILRPISKYVTLNFTSLAYGIIMDGVNLPTAFHNTQTLLYYTNYSFSKITVIFGKDADNINQTYQFNNEGSDIITENLLVFNRTNRTLVPFWVNVKGVDNSPLIENTVTLNMYAASVNDSLKPTLTHKILLNKEGKGLLYLDPNYLYSFVVTAEGYNAFRDTLALQTDIYRHSSEVTPYPIVLRRTMNNIDKDITFLLNRRFENRSKNMYGTIIFTREPEEITWTTDYAIANGADRGEAIEIEKRTYRTNILSGTHFSSTTTDDIIVYIYETTTKTNYTTLTQQVVTEIIGTYTIEYETLTTPYVEILPQTDTTSDSTLNLALLFIGLLLASAVMRSFLPNTTAGFHTFMIGVLFMTLKEAAFLYPAIICVLYYVINYVRKQVET